MEEIGNLCPNSLTGVSAHLFLTLINTLLASQCTLNSREDYPPNSGPLLKDQDEYDFIVVGAGSAGSIVANKLSENPNWKILVLEAGDYPSSTSEIPALLLSLQGTKDDWQYVAEPSENFSKGIKEGRCRWPRGKCVGGSSSINAMVYLRGNQRDFDEWVQEGNKDWNYETIIKHYKEIEDLQENSTQYGRGGYLPLYRYTFQEPIAKAIKKSAEILGYPTLNDEGNLGYFSALLTTNNGTRANTGKAFLGKVRERSNLILAVNATVQKIIIDNNKIATAVEVEIGKKKLTIKARKEIILSAGAINSPQILMLSGVGPKHHLQEIGIPVIQDLQVGENLQDHAIFVGFHASIGLEAVKTNDYIDELYQYFRYQRGAFSNIGLLNLLGFINTKNNSDYPNLQFHHFLFGHKDNYLIPTLLKSYGLKEEIGRIMLHKNQESPTLSITPTLSKPKSRGRIRLKSKRPYDKPVIYANYFENPEDVDIMLEGIRFAEKQLETEPFQQHKPKLIDITGGSCSSYKFKSEDYWKCALKYLSATVYHPVGTCKMGPKTDSKSVVDSRLRVHGIINLRVIDASIMPTIVTVNTNGAAMVIGQKGGSMIIEDWQPQRDRTEL